MARTGSEERRYLMRLGLKESRRDLQLVDNTTRVVTVAAAGRHWIVEIDTGLYRLEFTPAGARGSKLGPELSVSRSSAWRHRLPAG